MIKQMPGNENVEEKRRFERIDIASHGMVEVLDAKDRKVGMLRQLARGGFSMETDKSYNKDSKVHSFAIVESGENIRADVKARVRFTEPNLVGFEFVDLNAAAAVEIGIIIGKYYEHAK
jgi:PilZ domain-containing protein